MVTRDDLKPWIIDALKFSSGKAGVVEIAKHIWRNHRTELEESGDFFFKWQYEMRWAGQQLSKEGKIAKVRSTGVWELLGA